MTLLAHALLLAVGGTCWIAVPAFRGGISPEPTHVLTVGAPARIDLGALIVAGPDVVTGVRFIPESNGLRYTAGIIQGTPLRPAVLEVRASLASPGAPRRTFTLHVVVFAADLPQPVLPDTLWAYSDTRVPKPGHYLADVSGSALREDNSPADNPVSDAGATLGRVLFHDPRLSGDDRVACATCHRQEFGFADTARYSRGIGGALSRRHVMALVNARFYESGRFLRDERAATLEEQVLLPVANPTEMGLSLDAMVRKLHATSYYPPLFAAAFGSAEITSERVARALAQFIRSLNSYRAPVDSVFRGGGPPDLAWLTPLEAQGRALFQGRAACSRCHRTNALNLDLPGNIGLDRNPSDSGAGNGRFKVASLRNVAIRPPYMHDGRFGTLEEVVAFYDSGIQAHPHLDARLRQPDGSPQRLHLTAAERAAIVAYLGTFTDRALLTDPRFGNPFRSRDAVLSP